MQEFVLDQILLEAIRSFASKPWFSQLLVSEVDVQLWFGGNSLIGASIVVESDSTSEIEVVYQFDPTFSELDNSAIEPTEEDEFIPYYFEPGGDFP